jgi:predicted RNA-binding Zn ribbon-like protein
MTMANHLVSGLLVPDAVSGHLALELANTRAGWGSASPREYLVSYDALVVWAGDVGHLTAAETTALRRLAARSPRPADRVLRNALALRETVYRLLAAPAAAADPAAPAARPGPAGADLASLHGVAARAYRSSRLVVLSDGRVLPDGGDEVTSGLALPLHRSALAAAQLLAAGDGGHVFACAGRGCGWLFLDRAHRRRWCIMAICGNRAKAREFAARTRTRAGSLDRPGPPPHDS